MTSWQRDLAMLPLDGLPPAARHLAELLVGRFSCRGFRADQVPRATIDQLLAIAQLTPSWCNIQPWHVTVTTGAATDRLRDALLADLDAADASAPDIAFPTGYSGVRQARRREVAWQLYDSVGIERGDRVGSARQARENQRLFGAPHVLLIHTHRELGTYGAVDCGLYLSTLLLAAQSLGLGIIPQAALAGHAPLVRRHFRLPDDLVFVAGASFGFPDNAHPANGFRSRRSPPTDSVTFADR